MTLLWSVTIQHLDEGTWVETQPHLVDGITTITEQRQADRQTLQNGRISVVLFTTGHCREGTSNYFTNYNDRKDRDGERAYKLSWTVILKVNISKGEYNVGL